MILKFPKFIGERIKSRRRENALFEEPYTSVL
jgi:hypothetical protein